MKLSISTTCLLAALRATPALANDPRILRASNAAGTAHGEASKPARRLKAGKAGKSGKINKTLEAIPLNAADFDEPDWEAILELAFPTWDAPANGCPRLNAVGGAADAAFGPATTGSGARFNPCYYTKAFAGLNPSLGGYPTPIDTHYPYEFAAPFFRQPGDGSTHHCNTNDGEVDIGSCPKLGTDCGVDGDGKPIKDCANIDDTYGIGHIPPFVPLAAIKNEYQAMYGSQDADICKDWFHYETNGCNILKSTLDRLVYKHFGNAEKGTINFQPPILLDGKPSSTYYRLEYGGESPACDKDNCRGPHYCSEEVAKAGNIWGDFCPYVHTGPNAGKYRHPHLALAALELWVANQCMPKTCPATWLASPNGQGYAADATKATSITWCDMDDNLPMAQPTVPYTWPNSETGSVFPGLAELYPTDSCTKPAPGLYVTALAGPLTCDM